MDPNYRPQRNVFLLFLGTIFVALMSALPLVVAQNAAQPAEKAATAAQGATARQALVDDRARFEEADRNGDGLLDKSEAGRIPGLSAMFERADRNRDGKLDKAEFEKGLQILQVSR